MILLMDDRVRHGSDSCLAESPGKDIPSACRTIPGTVPLLYRAAQTICYLAKKAQTAMFGQLAPREWYPRSHCLMSHPVFHYFPGFREAAGFQVEHAERGR